MGDCNVIRCIYFVLLLSNGGDVIKAESGEREGEGGGREGGSHPSSKINLVNSTNICYAFFVLHS